MNKIIVIGNLTNEPVRGESKSGAEYTKFNIAVNRTTRMSGEEPEFFKVMAWGSLGDSCYSYLHKGRKAAVIGELSHSEYDGKDGKRHFVMEINAKEVEFLSKPEKEVSEKEVSEPIPFEDLTTDDIPF